MPLPPPKTPIESWIRIFFLILLLIPMTAFIIDMIGPFFSFMEALNR